MEKILYTIGYAHHTQESFLELLLKYHINCVIDVRTMPYSAFHMQFNKEIIKAYLNARGIIYIHMDEPFGIIKGDESLIGDDGYLDFKKLAKTELFAEGVARVERGLAKGYTIAFMCAEKDPTNCHRSTLVGRAFYERGYGVKHILHDGTLEDHREMEERMKEQFCPKDHQLHLFEASMDEGKRLQEAYDSCSREIFIVNAKRVLKDDYDYPKQK
ncbi:MAG: DUF488 family protein [Cellulosilyticaceae bacterium]